MTEHAQPSGKKRVPSMGRPRPSKMWTLRDPETLSLVFQAFEDLTTLQQRCAQQIAAAREEAQVFGQLLWDEGESRLRRWSRLSERVITIWSLLDETVRTNRLDPAQCQEAYRGMLRIRTYWARLESQRGSIPLIDRVTNHLRQLLIRYAQVQTHRGWLQR